MNQNTSKLFVFVALECEAKALINHFKLKKDNAKHPFSIYSNDNMTLTVTGVGKVAMAGGVAYVLAAYPEVKQPVLINVGIAGHKTSEIGSLFIASKVTDVESGRVFYPQLIGAKGIASDEIKSTVLPNTDYSEGGLNDMEASAFYEIAVKFSSCELIHCLKVVSDNETSSIEGINAKNVVEWVDKQLGSCEKVFEHLLHLRDLIVPIELPEYIIIIDRWHFTVSGKVKLKALLKRWRVLASSNWLKNSTVEYVTGKDILRQLAVDVESLEVNL